jgi:hypothetical protein
MNTIIQRYNKLLTEHTLELEARICLLHNSHKVVSNVNVYEFKAILEHMKTLYPKYKQYYQTITTYSNGIRQIYNSSQEIVYQRKTRILNIIADTFYSKYLKIKWSLNIEENIPKLEQSSPIVYVRKKNVHVFNILDGRWELYFIEAYSQTQKTYEIEVERIDTVSSISMNEINSVTNLVQDMFKNRNECRIVAHYNSLLEPNYKKFYSKWPINKPINLKYDMWTLMTKYNYFLKYDGERFLVMVYNNNLYAINETSVIKIGTSNLPNNTILDVEYMKDTSIYIIFDILVYNTKNVRTLIFTERRKILESLKLPNILQLSQLHTSFYDLWGLISTPEQNIDGIIFVPKYESYKNSCTFKYKPSHLLTIDFIIENNNQLFIDSSDGYVLFRGDIDMPYDSTKPFKCDFEYQPYDIIEFQYNTDENQFVALRKRVDKIKPNYITVALDIWKDIHNEIDIISFIQNISI